MKLRDVVAALQVGDVVWIRTEILGLGAQDVPLEDRHFSLSSPVISNMIGAEVYGGPEVFCGELDQTNQSVRVIEKEVVDKHHKGMVEAYEKILLGSNKITIN